MKTSFRFFCLFLVVSKLSFGQNKFEILAYELNERNSISTDDNNPQVKFQQYEFQNLFIKKDSTWVLNELYEKSKSTYVIKNNRLISCQLILMSDTNTYLPNRAHFYLGNKKVRLNQKYQTNFTVDWPFVKKLAFCTNNKNFKRVSSLKRYNANGEDIKLIQAGLYKHLCLLFSKNCEGRSSGFPDTLLLENRLSPKLYIDHQQSFIDQYGNKLIKFRFESRMAMFGIYPFNRSCFREDNGYGNPGLTVYITNENTVTYLSDELELLEYGDFDNDGKDEFIFWSSIFNHDKYILFYNDFSDELVYEWNYH